jgi:hypothetical protein
MKPSTVLTTEPRRLRVLSQHLEISDVVGKNRDHLTPSHCAAGEQVLAERSENESDRQHQAVTRSHTGDDEGYGRGD